MTPLHYSLFWKTPNVETLQFILSLPNIDVNAKTGKYGHTPLHLACNMTYCKDYSLANHLVEVPEVDINARGIDGITTPLDIAKTTFENLKAFPRYFNVSNVFCTFAVLPASHSLEVSTHFLINKKNAYAVQRRLDCVAACSVGPTTETCI